MKSRFAAVAAALVAFAAAGSAHAALIAFNPESNPSVTPTEYEGVVGPTGLLGANYKAFGIDFTFGGNEGYFNDVDEQYYIDKGLPVPAPFYLFGGAGYNLATHDPFEFVDGRIVVQNTLDQGATSFLSLYAGYAYSGTLTLYGYNNLKQLVGTAQNDCPPNGNLPGQCYSSITLNAPDIAYFRLVSTGHDTYGIREFSLETPTATAGIVPEPATWLMMILGFGGAGAMLRQRRLQPIRIRS